MSTGMYRCVCASVGAVYDEYGGVWVCVYVGVCVCVLG